MMKLIVNSTLAILILFQGLFSDVHVLNKFIEFAEDYQIHQAKYGDNLTTFLRKHFGDLRNQHQEQHQKEHQEHQNHNHKEITVSVDLMIHMGSMAFLPVQEAISSETHFAYKSLFSLSEKQKIFQPPKLS